MGFLAGLGSMVRAARDGNVAANAVVICSELTGEPLSTFEMQAKQSAYVCRNKEELALFLLVSYCEDFEDFSGELVRKLNPRIRDRILQFYITSKEQGLINNSYVDDEYSRFL